MNKAIEATIRGVKAQSPLVHSITNYVVMEVTANSLLAMGASPLMAHAPEEMDDLLAIVSALVLNIGTLDPHWITSMELAAQAAIKNNVPIVLDPVGAGASSLRTATALHLLNLAQPAVLRGNASEILALAADTSVYSGSKGVDSTNTPQEAADAAQVLARKFACVVSVSGEEDIITNGTQICTVHGGSPLMPRVTGMGCSATALTAAHVAVSESPLIGAAAAMAVMASAGERAAKQAAGPGSFLPAFLDALYMLDPAEAASRVQ